MSRNRAVDQKSLALHSGKYVERYNAKPISRVVNLIRYMGLTPETRIVDYACGNGMLLQAIGDNFASYDGVDFSSDFITSANEWAQRTQRARYRFHCCDIRDYCDRNREVFDVATTLDFAEHIDDVLAIEIYTSIRKSLRPGGRLFLHTPNLEFFMERARQLRVLPPFPEHIAVRNAQQTTEILVKSGFVRDDISVRVVPHYNILRYVHPLSKLPLVGGLFSARLWVEARV